MRSVENKSGVEHTMYRESKLRIQTEKRSRLYLSKNLIDYRKRLNISREHLALGCEIDVKYLSRIETGRANASLDVLDKLSDGTGIAAGELITK
ncbi:MAG: helix-turn-helix transcriptional regulator [Clostridia bacterium]|nr:helix-turn-helix transcriptional regulator [Clostridia bacterium]